MAGGRELTPSCTRASCLSLLRYQFLRLTGCGISMIGLKIIIDDVDDLILDSLDNDDIKKLQYEASLDDLDNIFAVLRYVRLLGSLTK